jgi:hypothetical protein
MATIIQDNDKLELVLEKFYNRYNKFNSKVLEMLGETISKFEGLSPSNAHILAQELKLGYDLDYLMEELSRISGKSIQDINKLFDEVAKENVNFSEAYFKAKNKEFINYEDNQRLQNIVETIKKETNNTFKNLSKSKNIGFTLKDNEGNITYKPISKIYNELIDEAVYNTSLGIKNYQSSMTNVIRQLADSGVKIHEEKVGYKNGYNKRIDSSVRQNVLTGMRRINIGIQEEIGDMLGTDGVEISAHFPCAEDHLDIQGRQYSNKEFDEINKSLDRPIGEYNCTHFIFSIILGVNEPSYSKNMLSRYKRYSQEKVSYNGKKYTKYEATQVQRQLETAIRQQKDRQIIARASNNQEEIGLAQQKITQLTNEYNKFSKKAGLDTYKNRLSVSGYHKVKVIK